MTAVSRKSTPSPRCALGLGLVAGVSAAVVALAGGFSAHAKASQSAARIASASASAACHRGGTLTLATDIQPNAVDPTTGQSDSGSEQTYWNMFDTLVENVGTTSAGNLQPGLAKSWTISPDGLTYTFHLRTGVRFANGAPFTSADVVFTFGRLLNNKANLDSALYNTFIKSVTAPNAATVVFGLKKLTPAFLGWLATGWMGIVPKAYYTKVGATAFAAHPIGTGPFKFVSWQHGQQMTFVRNPYYWRTGEPYFDKLVVQYIANDSTRDLNVQSGATDIALDVPFSQLNALSTVPGVHLHISNISTFDPLLINNGRKPFNEVVVRQALNYATPKSVINRVAFDDRAIVANSTIPPLHYWDSLVKPYPYDLAKARALLKKSTVPNGFSMTLTIVGTDQAEVLTAGVIQQAWAQIGVKVKIVQTDLGTDANDLGHETYDGLLQPATNSNSDIPLDDELAFYVDSPSGPIDSYFTHYNNPQVTKLIEAATSTQSDSTRRKLFAEIQQATVTNPPYVLLLFAPVRALIRNNIAGFQFISTYWYYLGGVCRTG